MGIYDGYTTKRKKLKGGYYTITYDQTGKKIGQTKWHGTNTKGDSPKLKGRKEIVDKHNVKLAKIEIPYKQWKKDGYSIGKKITYTEKNMRFPFSYEVAIVGISQLDMEITQWVTVQSRTPLEKEEILKKISKTMLSDYKFKKINKIKVENLILSKQIEYLNTYKKS